jgi:hypothetical protein
MPNWKYFSDIEGNEYFFDEIGLPRVILDNEKDNENLIIVSLSAIEYYMAKAEEHFRDANYVQSLAIIKSILAMPNIDMRVINSKKACIKLRDRIKNRIGTKINQEEEKIILFGYRIRENTVIFVKPMRLRITLNDCEVRLVRQRQYETDYKYNGFTLALQKDNVRILMSADSKKFVMQERIRLSTFRNNFYANLPAWPMKRLSYLDDEFEISEFTMNRARNFIGYERIGVNRNIGYCIRFICEEKDFDTVKADMLKWAENIRVIN